MGGLAANNRIALSGLLTTTVSDMCVLWTWMSCKTTVAAPSPAYCVPTPMSHAAHLSDSCCQTMRGAATWVAAFQKGRRYLEDEDLNLQP